MKNPMRSSRWLAFFSVGFALAAATAGWAQADALPPAAPVAVEQESLHLAPYEQHSDFTVAIRSVAAKIDTLIVPLTKRQKGGIAGGADAITLDNLQTSRTGLGHQIAKLEDVTPENWVSVRDAVLEALVQTQDAYAKAAQEYNNHP
jgi:hypothetical protein